ncbi:glycosyltransferase family 2 protein, partial [Pseudonocardia sp.]
MAIVCVNYHSERHCSELYDTLLTQNDPAWELVIVDNGSGDDRALLDELAARERVRVVRPDNNLGYFNGAQFGVDDLRVGPAAPEWIVVCNPDIRFDDAGFVAHLRRRDADEPLVLAPSVVSPVMGEQNPFMSSVPSRGRTALRTAVLSSHLLGRLAGTYSTAVTGRRRRSIAPTPPTQPEQRIFAPHGSVIVFSRGYFTAGLDVHH